MARFRRQGFSEAALSVPPLVRLMILRMLEGLGTHRAFIGEDDFTNDQLAAALGLERWIQPGSQSFDPRRVRADLHACYRRAERKAAVAEAPECLRKNVETLRALIGLSETDCRILEFAVLIHTERLLDDTADWLGQLSSAKVPPILAVMLALPEAEIRRSLSPRGILARSGLVSVGRGGSALLRMKIDVFSDQFADAMVGLEAEPAILLRGTVVPAPAPQIGLGDYDHIRPQLDVLRPYLRRALETRRPGVNVFVHGAPGTGKSQFVRALAQDFGCELFEIASEDPDGDPINGERRLRALRAAQCIFSQRQALLLFDEAEDVFNDGDNWFGRKSTAQTRKAWINRSLEGNTVPTLWLSNAVTGLDPAFVRRFDMVFELPVPPQRQRERILREACADLLSPAILSRLAASSELAPAVVTKAAEVVRSIRDDLGEPRAAAALEQLIDDTLEAQGHRPTRHRSSNQLPELYDPAFINADTDLGHIAAGLIEARAGRLCLFGPSGTGKSAFGRWVAEQLAVPLVAKKASDLMSMWVGGSERNVAAAFREAEADTAVLLLDEVDSFLLDRRGAQRGWEVSLVNEMLTQIESFGGVFIASTNLMDGLDPAALRRFDLKVRFDFMRPDQAAALLTRYCRELRLDAPSPAHLAWVAGLRQLTPGDFAAVARQNRFRPLVSPAALVAALEQESTLKPGPRRSIGFVT